MNAKRILGENAASLVQDGMTVGLGTGTTAEAFIGALGERMRRENLSIKGVPTSLRTEKLAQEKGIPIEISEEIDIAVDGADEVDKNKNLLKGGGGAMLREKIVDYAAREFVCIIEDFKMVEKLSMPVPCEVLPFSLHFAQKRLKKLGEPHMRIKEGKPFFTDNCNLIFDLKTKIDDPGRLECEINQIPGVLGNGLFTRECRVLVVNGEGKVSEL